MPIWSLGYFQTISYIQVGDIDSPLNTSHPLLFMPARPVGIILMVKSLLGNCIRCSCVSLPPL